MKKIKLTFLFLLVIISGKAYSQTASLQVIHNAADPAVSVVDIYVNGTLTLNDFAFRSATPFLNVPSGVVLNIGFAPPSSATAADTIVNIPVVLDSAIRYVAIANGVLDTSLFAANPDMANIGFTIFAADSLQTIASNPANVDFIVVHGSTDAPTVDVTARNVATIVNNASYGDITGYISVPAGSYIIDLEEADSNSAIYASFAADLTTLAGEAFVVIASGFLDTAANQNGPAFGLWAFLDDGTAIALPAVSLSRLQVIHNAADPGAASVDIYLDTTLALNDFAFRTATPYIDIPAGVPVRIGIAPPNSSSISDTLTSFQVTLVNGETYLAVANGVLNPASFAANPDALPIAFTLFLQDEMRESAVNSGDVDIRVIHGATDAPTVDVVVPGVGILVDNAAYGAITPYISVPPGSYQLDITPGNNNSVIVASFSANLTSLAGETAVVLASGFLDPSMNLNGAAFGLLAVLADGTAFMLGNSTGIDENFDKTLTIYPNPASNYLYVNFETGNGANAKLTVTDISGRTIIQNTTGNNLNTTQIDISGLDSGNYFLKIESDNAVSIKRFVVAK
jgi:hypothetical protein